MLNPSDTPLAWRKSQRCDSGTCVEVAQLPDAAGVALRDSTRPDDAILRFSQGDWTSLLADLRKGQL